MMVAEALECLGGNGYVEESGMPLLFRESPLNSIWEGSGNVNALDVLRALSREPEVLDGLDHRGRPRPGRGPAPGPRRARVLESLADTSTLEVGARRLAGQMAACLQGALLVRHAPAAVADAFCATRLGDGRTAARSARCPPRHRPRRHRRADDSPSLKLGRPPPDRLQRQLSSRPG